MEKMYRIREAADLLGISKRHLQRLDKQGKITCIRTMGGHRRIREEEIKKILGEVRNEEVIAMYARVSSQEQKQKGDLTRQIEYLKKVLPNEYREVKIITDVSSGLNDKRKGFLELIELAKGGKIKAIAVSDKDRLSRFGFNYIEKFFSALGVKIYVICEEEKKTVQEELVQDMIAILTSFSGKLYGMRSKKRKKLLETMKEVVSKENENGSK